MSRSVLNVHSVLIGMAALAAVWLSGAAFAAGWHADRDAGIRLPLPFEDTERKTADQVTKLVLEQRGTAIPATVVFTSGLYAKAGVPYLLVWKSPVTAEPSQAALDAGGFDRERLDRIVDGPASADGDQDAGLRLRILERYLRDRRVFVGLYYRDAADAAILDELRPKVEVEPELRLHYDDLPRGRPAPALFVLVAALAAAGGFTLWRRRQRASRS